ncbi:MAG: hypothetical protein HDR01_15990 [Lachnospiraceae bacterium]|nr:hypothetical protein [Lachnospiraceae bacterium]
MNFFQFDIRFGAGFCGYDLFTSYNGCFKPLKSSKSALGIIYEEGILTMDNQVCRGIIKTKPNGEKRIQKLMPLLNETKHTRDTEDAKLARHIFRKLKNDKERFPIYYKNVLRYSICRIGYGFLCLGYTILFFNMIRLHLFNLFFMTGLLALGILMIWMAVLLIGFSPL